jgi:CO dehydrogenase maturation factor
MKIAVSGKGGTGKTTIAALIVRSLLNRGQKPVLVVDADPNANLGDALGIEVTNTVGRVLDEFLKDKDHLAAGTVKQSVIDYRLSEILAEEKGYDLLSMGQGEGPGCYCYPNSIVRNYIEKLAANYRHVVIDNEAGMEHLSRRTNGSLDVLFLISDPSLKGVRTCGKLADLVAKLGLAVDGLYLLLNRVKKAPPPQVLAEVEKLKMNLAGVLPEDPLLTDYELDAKSLLAIADTSPAVMKLEEVLARTIVSGGATKISKEG